MLCWIKYKQGIYVLDPSTRIDRLYSLTSTIKIKSRQSNKQVGEHFQGLTLSHPMMVPITYAMS